MRYEAVSYTHLELLILDEPINGLDPIGIAEVRSFIRELCDTCLLYTSIASFVPVKAFLSETNRPVLCFYVIAAVASKP